MFNTFVNPIALDSIGWKYYFVFVAVLIAYEITVYFAYPETRGHTLEDMAMIFDKDIVRDDSPPEGMDKNGSVEFLERV